MKKITIKQTLVLLLSLSLLSNVFAVGDVASLSGDGTEANPYLIGSVANLQAIGDGSNGTNLKGAYYKFTADIDFDGLDNQKQLWHNGGFVGHIDGNGFAIKNVTISTQSWLKYETLGFSGGVFFNFQGTMKNLGFENVKMYTDPSKAASAIAATGIISGALLKESTVENCYVLGGEIKRATESPIGALFGVVQDTVTTVISNCYADIAISSTSTAAVGGIVGLNGGTIKNTAFYGSLPAAGSYSIAMNEGEGTVASSYFKTEAAPANVTTGSTAIAQADLKDATKYSDLDFVTRPGWVIGDDYAVLKLTSTVVSNVAYANVGTKNNAMNASTYTNDVGLLIYPPMDSADVVFQGWYRDASFTDKVADTVAVVADPAAIGDLTFYAKWVALATYTITYENLGDAMPNNAAEYKNDTAVFLRAVSDYKGGDSSFVAWYKDAALTIPVGKPAIAVASQGDQTFYAEWVERPFKTGGDGSEENPYQVSTVYDLQMLGFVPGWSYFMMINDIDMAGEKYTPVKNLSGVFNGNGYEISNLTINGQGFVKELAGRIENLGLVGINVNSTEAGTGAFAGIMWNGTDVKAKGLENCYVVGDTIRSSVLSVGALIGYCWTTLNMVTNCYADVHVVGKDEVGGLFGRAHLANAAGISNCAFYGTIETTGALSGAIIGKNQGAKGTVGDSFYFLKEYLYGLDFAIDKASTVSQDAAVGLTWDELADAASYTKFDFTEVWEVLEIDEEAGKSCAVLKAIAHQEPSAIAQVERTVLGVYPNPSAGVFNFELEAKAQVTICDLSGKLIMQRSADAGFNAVDLSDRQGIFILRVKTADAISINRLIVK